MKKAFKKISVAVVCAVIIFGASLFGGCHVFPWFIPIDYSKEQQAEIFRYIENEALDDVSSYIASVTYTDDEGVNRYANIWGCSGKLIMNFDLYTDYEAVWYDGVYKRWDRKQKTEYVEETGVEKFQFLLDYVERFSAFLKTAVGPDYVDGDFYRCFPWNLGFAQVTYNVDVQSIGAEQAVLRAEFTVEQYPRIHSANFSLGTDDGAISVEIYRDPYDIDYRIQNILANYENDKDREPFPDDEFF